MDKRQFYDNLHKQLADKHGVSPNSINTIRHFALSGPLSREEIMDWADEKIKKGRNSSSHDVSKTHLEVFSFLENLSDEDFAEITQKTEFDK